MKASDLAARLASVSSYHVEQVQAAIAGANRIFALRDVPLGAQRMRAEASSLPLRGCRHAVVSHRHGRRQCAPAARIRRRWPPVAHGQPVATCLRPEATYIKTWLRAQF